MIGPQLSLVIPMHNEADNAGPLLARLYLVLGQLGESYEVIAVDDGSTDATLELLNDLQRLHPGLRIVSLARNFGQHAAVIAGFEASRGEWIITLDADLQNPPEEVPKLVAAFRRGADLVNTYRALRRDNPLRRLASRLVNRLMSQASGIELRDFGCMLRGYHRTLVQALTERSQHRTFIPALAMLYARRPVEIPVAHERRTAGASRYSLWKLFTLQLDLVISCCFGTPRVLFAFGACVALLGVSLGALLLVLRLIYGPEWAVEGVFTLFAVLFLFIGAQFAALGLLGEYLARIFHEVLRRPVYLVRETPAHRQQRRVNGPSVATFEPRAGSRP